MKGIVILLGIVASIPSWGQAGSASQGPARNSPTYQINHINHNRMQTYNWAERPDEEVMSLEKKFIKQEWTTGYVYFKSGRPFMEVPVIFDEHNDMLYYKQGEVIMEFVDTVSQFSLLIPMKKDSFLMVFRRNYPAIQANTPYTFYQVLVEGKVTLLKCTSKTIQLFNDDMKEEKRKDPLKERYFVSMPGGKIAEVSFDAEMTLKNMAEYDWMLRDIMKTQKLKLKDEGRLIELINQLNLKFQ